MVPDIQSHGYGEMVLSALVLLLKFHEALMHVPVRRCGLHIHSGMDEMSEGSREIRMISEKHRINSKLTIKMDLLPTVTK